jgi:tRNA(fMet)-specific endonuclease VapC
MFILDTDHVGILQWQSEPEFSRLRTRIARHSETDFFVTIVSFHEQILGWSSYIANAKKIDGVVKAYGRLFKIIANFNAGQVLAFDDDGAIEFTRLRSQKIRVGTMDLRIASIALSRSMIVLSRNMSDFQKVPGLRVEDWTQ